MKLYEIADKYQDIWDKIDQSDWDEEKQKEDPEAFDKQVKEYVHELEDIEGELSDKADAYATMMRSLQKQEDILKEEKQRLDRRKKSAERKREFLKESLKETFQQLDIRKVTTEKNTIFIRRNQPRVVIDDEDNVPDEYVKIKREWDKKKVKEALKDGEVIPGTHLEPSESIQIK